MAAAHWCGIKTYLAKNVEYLLHQAGTCGHYYNPITQATEKERELIFSTEKGPNVSCCTHVDLAIEKLTAVFWRNATAQ